MAAAHIKPSDFGLAARLTTNNLYEWQNQTMDAVANGYRSALCAPNGSGKSSTVVCFLILWFLHEYPRGRVVVTSGSWTQLENQVFNSLKAFATHPFFANWQFLDSHVETPQGGFATASASMIPAKPSATTKTLTHPSCSLSMRPAPSAMMSFWLSTNAPLPFNLSPAPPALPPADSIASLLPKPNIGSPEDQLPRLSAPQGNSTPHRPRPLRRRLHLLQKSMGISLHFRWRRKRDFVGLYPLPHVHPPAWEQPGFLTAGCDFAAGGGNLCVLALARGNKLELDQARWCWSHANTNHSAAGSLTSLENLNSQCHQIFADGDGLGRGFVDNLEECGFFVREIHNGAAAKDSNRYASIVAEQWDSLAILIVKKRIILPNCEELFAQLSNRRREYAIRDGLVKIKLESKQDMRARNVSSPDLADACVLALMNGWGSLPGNLNPERHERLHKELQECARMIERARSPFATGYVSFRGW